VITIKKVIDYNNCRGLFEGFSVCKGEFGAKKRVFDYFISKKKKPTKKKSV